MEDFGDILMLIGAALALIGLTGLGVISVVTAFSLSPSLGFLAVFLIGLLVGITASNLSN